MPRKSKSNVTFGIAEWYGRPFESLTVAERRDFVSIQSTPKADRPPIPCPFQSTPQLTVPCTKKGGVCSLRKYELSQDPNGTRLAKPADKLIRTTCPHRFKESGEVYKWIGEVILGTVEVVPIGQIAFLKPVPQMAAAEDRPHGEKEVGRIDNILVVPKTDPLKWCAVEIQAVYFSGTEMKADFTLIQSHLTQDVPFPAGRRHPDYRSSGPKRLLPQLLIKVPTLSTWGKKLAVVVDEAFFGALGQMKPQDDLSNAQVIWFVVSFTEMKGIPKLSRSQVFMTRLDDARDGLVAAKPVTSAQFEQKILAKIPRA
jgi:hypothetical protein